MKKINLLEKKLKNKNQTQLGIGPMSKNCVDAVIELADEIEHPLMLIASRRQIECNEHGGGYVNNWSTESFADYVQKKDKKGFVILCRDHGGPWQNYQEVAGKLSLEDAMESAKKSFEADIKSGFEIIHIDPSIDIHKTITGKEVMERVYELYEFCMNRAAAFDKTIRIEIGVEQQTGEIEDTLGFKEMLVKIKNFCRIKNFLPPLFVVAQTGTLIKETENIGNFKNYIEGTEKDLKKSKLINLLKTCFNSEIYLKEHNADYLSNEALSWHPKIGIPAANIAPEFGVSETLYILEICRKFNLKEEKEDFLSLAFESGKWKKWMKDKSQADDRQKAIIAGHYIFSKEEFKEIAERIRKKCSQKNFDFDANLKKAIKKSITRIIRAFNLN